MSEGKLSAAYDSLKSYGIDLLMTVAEKGLTRGHRRSATEGKEVALLPQRWCEYHRGSPQFICLALDLTENSGVAGATLV